MDYFSHLKDGYGQDGLPLENREIGFCENCNCELYIKNKPKFCTACGESGCQKCLKEQDNGYQYACPGLECFVKVVDMFRASLNRFILNCGDKNDN